VTLRRVDLNAPAPADPEEPPHAVPESGRVRSLAPMILAVIAIVLMLKYAQAMVIPVVLGLLMSYALDPLVTGLTKLRIHEPSAPLSCSSPW
jgi:predicted PurR-regulated permease PerM